jgi:cellulose synthase/poly-beta-1,6-N-acetylglucosamine synthase-like glycosyltransferase
LIAFASAAPGTFLSPPLALARGAAVVTYAVAQAMIVAYASHRWWVLARAWRRARGSRFGSDGDHGAARQQTHAMWPLVTVQLPVYNERRVIERLIDAASALDYSKHLLEIQVLDDSTDETSKLAANAIAKYRARGIDIRHVRRAGRAGFKAGALAAGLASARGELIAVFDADFVPRPDFLRRMVPHFADLGVGMAQARWTPLNRAQSWLTRAQAVMLDAHFLLEHEARMRARLFFNFNGTAGVWRRSCIETAGGWAHDTLTEDLDLSYRAQLAGWKFVFDPTTEVPAELPADVEALKSQQRRWAKGSIQTARKVLPALFASAFPGRVKLEALIHLTANFAYPLLLAIAVLLLPVLLGANVLPAAVLWGLQALVILLGVLPVVLFLVEGSRAAGVSARRIVPAVLAALVLGTGLAVNNARAVFEGIGGPVGDWQRTPKAGDARDSAGRARYRSAERLAGRTELALAIYFTGLGAFAWSRQLWRVLPFAVLLIAGFACVGLASWNASRPRLTAE